MMSAFFSAVSGLKSQTSSLNVIANNIANVNTNGYKSQRTSFSDVLSQTIRGASGASANRGGTNPIQIGLGVGVASTDTNMNAGSPQATGISTDVAISGRGFFVVSGGSPGDFLYTREGDMTVDEQGNMTVNGYQVCGWMRRDADGNIITTGEPEPINIYSDRYIGNKKHMAASKSSKADFGGALDSSKTAHGTGMDDIGTVPEKADATSSMTFYDAQGNPYQATVSWYKCYVDSTDPDNPVTSWYYEVDSKDATISPASGYVKFDKNGNIIDDDANFSTTPQITVSPDSGVGAAPFTVNFDFGDIITSASTNGVTASPDGYPAGTLAGISIEKDGTITGTYSNGQTQSLGMIALAQFTNDEGLEKTGNNMYRASANSGNVSYYSAGDGGSSPLNTGCLEMSNVDLAQEFSNMMISQRAYQANSKVISTADEMLQSLINMR